MWFDGLDAFEHGGSPLTGITTQEACMWMDGWMDWMDEWFDGFDALEHGRSPLTGITTQEACMWMDGLMDGWMDG